MKVQKERFMLIVPSGTSPEGVDVRNHVPLGSISVLAELHQAGYDVKLLDCVGESRKNNYENPSKPYFTDEFVEDQFFRKTGLITDEVRDQIRLFMPDVIGISCLTLVDRAETKKIVRNIKKDFPNIPIILGGHEASQSFSEILGFSPYEIETIPGIDYVVVGPGQPTIVKLMEYLNGRFPKEKLEGVAFVEEGKLQFSAPFKPFNPNRYALPDYGLLPKVEILGRDKPIDIYSLVGNTHAGDIHRILQLSNDQIISYMALLTSYGCGYHCTFCDNEPVLSRYAPHNVLGMIHNVDKMYGIDYIDFMDNNFGGKSPESRQVALDILKQLEGKGYSFGFSNGLTFESMFRNDFELLKAIKKAGTLRHIAFPIENGNDRVLRAVKKPHDLAMVEKTLKFFNELFRDEPVNKEAFFIGGFPETGGQSAETPEEVNRTCILMEEYLKRGWLDQAIFLTLSPVTKEYRKIWRAKHPNGPFEKALFSRGTDLWPYDPSILRDIHERVREINKLYGKSSVTRRL
jgi:radical SAM superfamily enzyme YgiQ (UPF0313 family)